MFSPLNFLFVCKFKTYLMKAFKGKCKMWPPPNPPPPLPPPEFKFKLFIFIKPACRFLTDDYFHLDIFLERVLWADSVSPWMNTIAPRDQFKPIRIRENLVANNKGSPQINTFALLDQFKPIRNGENLVVNYKQLLDEVFVISGIIKVEVSVISRSRRLRLITLTEILIIPDITKAESNNCFIMHCFDTTNALSQRSQSIFKHLKMYNFFTVFIKQSSGEKLNAFLKKVHHWINFLLDRWSESRRHSYFALRELDIALGNHALRAQPADYSLICRYRLVNNL